MKIFKSISAVIIAITLIFSMCAPVFAEGAESSASAPGTSSTREAESENTVRDYKAIAAAAIIGLAAAAGAIAMALTIMKTIDGIARQPEAASSIRSAMMLGLVFIETAIIYALIVAILVVFVL